MNRYAVRMAARHCPAGILPPRRTVPIYASSKSDAVRRAVYIYGDGWRVYAARLEMTT